jgi:predicted TIM-barrel fold metal-dependent hydrolase
MGAMGDPNAHPSPERRYMDHIPYGAGDPKERLALLDQEHLEAALLYPTIHLLCECEVVDPAISLAYCRAYNRWIADFCRDSGGRLVPIAHLTVLDPEGSAAELKRAVADGCKGGWVAPFTHTRKGHGHPDHDALWRAAVELDVPKLPHRCCSTTSALISSCGRRTTRTPTIRRRGSTHWPDKSVVCRSLPVPPISAGTSKESIDSLPSRCA